MSNKSEQLRERLAALKAEIAAVEKAETERRNRESRKAIERAAKRSGLLALGLEADVLVGEFRAIVTRRRDRATTGGGPTGTSTGAKEPSEETHSLSGRDAGRGALFGSPRSSR